jgi:hypothetical protein
MLALLHVLDNVLLLLLVLLMLVVMVLVLLKLDVSSTGKSIATMDGCTNFCNYFIRRNNNKKKLSCVYL